MTAPEPPLPSDRTAEYVASDGSELLSVPSLEGPGTRIGPYRIVQSIGEGGFGSVFMAEQEQPVRRTVALKVIKLGMDTRQVVARFEQERQALAMMDHPNIARVLDAGATESGRPFFVMELVRGEPIVAYCDRNSLPIDERLALFVQVCHAVQHAHTKGIIHRDIKPSNVLVSVQDGAAVAKVIDFGIAKATSAKLTDRTVFTEHRQLIGTPEYMSPEQAEGSLDIDTRTDVYSLGVLLYELLTGATPFSGTELRSASYAEIQRIIREVDPPAPSTRLARSGETITAIAARRRVEPRRLNSTVRGELDWIVMKALEKDRQRRYQGASGLAADLERYLGGLAVEAAPPSAVYRFRKFVRRNRVGVAGAGAVAASLLLGAVAFAWQAKVASDERDRAVEAERESTRRAEDLRAVAEFQASMLSGLDPAEAGSRLMGGIRSRLEAELARLGVPEAERAIEREAFERSLSRVNATDTAVEMIDRTILRPAIAAIDQRFAGQPLIDASLRSTLAELCAAIGLNEAAQPLQERALEIRTRELGNDDRDTLRSLDSLAMIRESRGAFVEAEGLYRQAFESRRRAFGDDDPDTIASMGNLGNILRFQGKNAEAEPLLRASLEGRLRTVGPDHRDTLIARNTLGFLYVQRADFAAAEGLWREAYETGKRSLGADHPDVLVWTNNLAGLLQGQGKHTEAEALYRASLEGYRRVRGDEHPSTITVEAGLGLNLMLQGRFVESEAACRDLFDRARRTLGEEHPITLNAAASLGVSLVQCDRSPEAEPILRSALAARERSFGQEHRDSIVASSQLGRALAGSGKFVEADAIHREAIERSGRLLGEEHPETLSMRYHLAFTLLLADRIDEAATEFAEIVELRLRVSGEDNRDTLAVRSGLAVALERQGHHAEAITMARDVLDRLRRTLGPNAPQTLTVGAALASPLLREGGGDNAREAESLLRASLEGQRGSLGPNHGRIAISRLHLGMALLDLGRFDEAVVELAEAEPAILASPAISTGRKREILDLVAGRYGRWERERPGEGFAEIAARWAAKRDSLR